MSQESGISGTQTPELEIHVDGKPFKIRQATMTGAQIKGLVGRGPDYQLFLELGGSTPDKPIGDTESVALKTLMHFYTVPSASFGFSEGADGSA